MGSHGLIPVKHPQELLDKFGNNLKNLIEEYFYGVNIALGKQAGVAHNSVSGWISGRTAMTLIQFLSVSKVFKDVADQSYNHNCLFAGIDIESCPHKYSGIIIDGLGSRIHTVLENILSAQNVYSRGIMARELGRLVRETYPNMLISQYPKLDAVPNYFLYYECNALQAYGMPSALIFFKICRLLGVDFNQAVDRLIELEFGNKNH